MNVNEKRKLKADLKAQARQIDKLGESRELTPEEQAQFDDLVARVAALEESIKRAEALGPDEEEENEGDDEKDVETNSYSRKVEARRVSKPIPVENRAAAVHTKKHRYSMFRGIQALLENRRLDGLEGELHQEISKRKKKSPQGFYMPTSDEFREMRAGFDTTAGTGSIFVTPQLPFIELLRNKMILKELGATFLSNMDGKFAIPRLSAATQAYWVTENNAVTTSNPTLDQVAFVDKTVGAYTDISRKLLYQSNLDIEALTTSDLATVLAIEVDRSGLNGSGSNDTPLGILQDSGVPSLASPYLSGSDTHGLALTNNDFVAMETVVANANAETDSCKYAGSYSLRGYTKVTPKIGTTFPIMIGDGNEVNGRPFVASTQIPNNLTKGTGSNLSAVIYGNWSDLVVADWGAVEIQVNPYVLSTSGAVRIVALGEFDIQMRHKNSFVKYLAAKTS